MKRIIVILIFLPLMAITAMAQHGLNVEKFFAEDFALQHPTEVTQVNLSGKYLKQLSSDFTSYSSVKIVNEPTLIEQLEKAVMKDGAHARKRTTKLKNGHLYYGMYTLTSLANGENRYLIFRYKSDEATAATKAILIYIQGVATEADINALF
jgi:hypothetical protein